MRIVARLSSEAPVILPPLCSTLRMRPRTSGVSRSPGHTTGTPGGYGLRSSAHTSPAASSKLTLQ